MSVPAPPRSHPFLFGFMGLSILGASVWVFSLILHSVYGRYDLADLVPTRENLSAAFASPRAAILASHYSEGLLPDGSAWLRDNVATWEKFLRSTGAQVDVLDDQTAETGGLKGHSLVILAGSRALSEKEIGEIKKFIEGGGSLFATGGTGSFTERGDWRGWDVLSEVFGMQFTRAITPDQPARLHTLRGGLPITAGIPTGYSLKVSTWDNPIACRVVEPRTTQASTWYNLRSDSGLVRESMENSAGMAYGSYGRGRFVWMGFELNSVLGNQNDYVYFDVLCRQCVDWLTGTPTVLVRDWPAGFRAGAMIVMPVTGAPSSGMLASFRDGGVPLTSFVEPGGGAESSGALDMLRAAGDVGALLGGQVEPGSAAAMSALAGAPVAGLLPVSGRCDDGAIGAYLNAGYRYVVSDSLSDRAVPAMVIKAGRPIVLFTKTARGDDEVVRQFGLKDTALQLYTYREDVDRVLFQGGLYLLMVHPGLQGRPEYTPVLRELARYLKEKNVWIATGTEVSRWWLSRSALQVTIETRSRRRIALVVSNSSAAGIDGVVIQLNINKPVANVALTSDILGTEIPPFRYNPRTQIMEITIASLKSGGSLSLFVDFDQPSV